MLNHPSKTYKGDYALKAVLYLGEMVEHGPAELIFNQPRDERTRSYIEGKFIGVLGK